jgi:arylsulfatase A-like enzyme
LIVSAPDQSHPGESTRALVEFVDIYPTLCDLAGLPEPDGLEGISLEPVMEDPGIAWKTAAFSQYPRYADGKRLMGYSMRTDRYRFTRWENREDPEDVLAVEIYDHRRDPGENVNLAAQEGNEVLIDRLTEQYRHGWKGALPPVDRTKP